MQRAFQVINLYRCVRGAPLLAYSMTNFNLSLPRVRTLAMWAENRWKWTYMIATVSGVWHCFDEVTACLRCPAWRFGPRRNLGSPEPQSNTHIWVSVVGKGLNVSDNREVLFPEIKRSRCGEANAEKFRDYYDGRLTLDNSGSCLVTTKLVTIVTQAVSTNKHPRIFSVNKVHWKRD
jgi:hypothetical protein